MVIEARVPVTTGQGGEGSHEQRESGGQRRPCLARDQQRDDAKPTNEGADSESAEQVPGGVHGNARDVREQPEHLIPEARVVQRVGLGERFDKCEVAM